MADTGQTEFVAIEDEATIDDLFDRSRERPVVIFKDDPYCIVSVMARRALAPLGTDIPTIDVAGSRALSLGLAQRTGVRHESPQVLVLRDGKAVWSASHGAISATAVERALAID